MFSERDQSRKRLMELLDKPGNGTCADCAAADPEWASYTLGVFVCHSCSGLHRNIAQVSKVKSLLLDPWTAAQLELMDSVGNLAANAKYQQTVPAFYYRPTSKDCALLREQWIRAKYERKEFMPGGSQEAYSAGYREGFLWKRGRDNGQYLSRKFILSEREGALKYFVKPDGAKAVMSIGTLNATFQPSKIGTAHGLQITYLKDNSTRNIFVYHEDGKEMVDWFNAVRAPDCTTCRWPSRCSRGGPVAQGHPQLCERGLHGEDRPQAHRGFQEEMVLHGREEAHVLQRSAGRLRARRGVHRQQGRRLQRPAGPPGGRPELPLAVRHHRRHAGQDLLSGVRERAGANGLGGHVADGARPAHAAARVRGGGLFQTQTLTL